MDWYHQPALHTQGLSPLGRLSIRFATAKRRKRRAERGGGGVGVGMDKIL